jgi:hypothetical protein
MHRASLAVTKKLTLSRQLPAGDNGGEGWGGCRCGGAGSSGAGAASRCRPATMDAEPPQCCLTIGDLCHHTIWLPYAIEQSDGSVLGFQLSYYILLLCLPPYYGYDMKTWKKASQCINLGQCKSQTDAGINLCLSVTSYSRNLLLLLKC